MWTIACSRSRQPGRAGQLVRVVGDRGGVAGGAGIAQRERLEQQAEHALVADVELVRAALDLLRVRLALQQRAQQQLVDAEREREQADDPGAEDLEAVDGHRGHHGARRSPTAAPGRRRRGTSPTASHRAGAACGPAIIRKLRRLASQEDAEDRDARSRPRSRLVPVERVAATIPPSSGNVV